MIRNYGRLCKFIPHGRSRQKLSHFLSDWLGRSMPWSIYKQSTPLVNAMKKPGEWNVYDIIYEAPSFKSDGRYRTYPFVTLIHNGIIVQNHTRINGTTPYVGFPKAEKHGAGPIKLQDHGDPWEASHLRFAQIVLNFVF